MAGNLRGNIRWLTPITLDPAVKLNSESSIAAGLRKQLTAALRSQRLEPTEMRRCVYVVRMFGDFVVSYPKAWSPVLYIGRGSAFTRLASHLKNWLSQVVGFGKDVRIEIRICVPRRQKNRDLFKFVEAHLISEFQRKYGCAPFFNRRFERSNEGKTQFTSTDEKQFAAAIGVGRGKRPRWAIAPTPANPNYANYYKGWG